MATTIPTPRYQIGDVVHRADYVHVREQLACPDCLNTRRWQIKTPAGYELACRCARCSDYPPRTVAGQTIPSLTVLRYTPSVLRLTIGAIRINTADERDPVEYMATETGIGSGSIYFERDLHPTRGEAERAAAWRVLELNAKQEATPEAIRTAEFGQLHLEMAFKMADWEAVYRAWDYARRYREAIDDVTSEEQINLYRTRQDIVEYLTQAVSDTERYEFVKPHPLEQLMTAAGNSTDPTVREAVKRLYEKFPRP